MTEFNEGKIDFDIALVNENIDQATDKLSEINTFA